jgi:Arc/MetJ-type ribon-helix-helix transcriptional regulator
MQKDVKTSVTLSVPILNWIDEQIKKKKFASRSHAVEYCVYQEMKKEHS